MLRIFSLMIYKILKFLNKIFFFITNRSFIQWLIFFMQRDSYLNKKINDKNIQLFSPNNLISWRIRTMFDKEPDTIEWIKNFIVENKRKVIFWDIGANIGLYSIYCASIHTNKSVIFAFEPSTSNLRVLSRNIFINNFHKDIIINQLPLTNKPSEFLPMKENAFEEGVSLNTFGENFDFEGKNYISENEYSILGTSIDYLIENKIMDIPDYIKIDVDGIEHLILEGGKKTLLNIKIKSILIEVNENFIDQKELIDKLMKESGFKLKQRFTEKLIPVSNEFSKTFNYIYER